MIFDTQFGFTILKRTPGSDPWNISTLNVVKVTMTWHISPPKSLKNGGVLVTREIGDVCGFKVIK